MPHPRTDLAIHGARVALTPARALTSHLRRRYEERYRHRYQRAAIVFGFDLFLLGVCVAFAVINLWLLLAKPKTSSGIDVALFAPPLKTATPLAFEARLVVTDNKIHDRVSLVWELPPQTEILSASPAMNDRHEVFIGRLEPYVTTTVRVAVRLFPLLPTARIGIRLQDDGVRFIGSETRPLVGSGLKLEPLLSADAYAAGATIPFTLTNLTTQSLADIRLVGGTVYGTTSTVSAEAFTLAPAQEVLVLANAARSSSGLQAYMRGARLVDQRVTLSSTTTADLPRVTLPITTPGQSSTIESRASRPFQLVVIHPALQEAQERKRTFDIPAGDARLPLSLNPQFRDVVERWFAFPVQMTPAGQRVLLPAIESRGTTSFDVLAQARYYTSEGDQLGIGPLPPQVGQTTKYWIHWRLDPVQRDLSRLQFRGTLAPGVSATGRTALPDGGTLEQVGNAMQWDVPFVSVGATAISASFEVALTPTEDMRGQIAPLMVAGEAQGLENRSETWLRMRLPQLDTGLVGDERAIGQGIVR